MQIHEQNILKTNMKSVKNNETLDLYWNYFLESWIEKKNASRDQKSASSNNLI